MIQIFVTQHHSEKKYAQHTLLPEKMHKHILTKPIVRNDSEESSPNYGIRIDDSVMKQKLVFIFPSYFTEIVKSSCFIDHIF